MDCGLSSELIYGLQPLRPDSTMKQKRSLHTSASSWRGLSSRQWALIGSVAVSFALVATALMRWDQIRSETPPPLGTVVVYKTPDCECCARWVKHLEASGIPVQVREDEPLTLVKKRLQVPKVLFSCHTAEVDGYAIEGHVPAADIQRLLRERPAIAGIGVAGMPNGSPGMEGYGAAEHYQTMQFDRAGKIAVYSSH